MKENVNVVHNSLRPHGLVACQAPKRQPVYDLLEKAYKLKGQKVCWFAKLLGRWIRGLVNKGTGVTLWEWSKYRVLIVVMVIQLYRVVKLHQTTPKKDNLLLCKSVYKILSACWNPSICLTHNEMSATKFWLIPKLWMTA